MTIAPRPKRAWPYPRLAYDRSADMGRVDAPTEGHWIVQLVARGPLVPAAIQRVTAEHEPGAPENAMERHAGRLQGYISGQPVDVETVWLMRKMPVSAQEYEFRVAEQEWCRQHAPDDPLANPLMAVKKGG